MSTFSENYLNESYLAAHYLSTRLNGLDRTLQHIDIVEASACTKLTCISIAAWSRAPTPAKRPISFGSIRSTCPPRPRRERQAERASHEQRSSSEGEGSNQRGSTQQVSYKAMVLTRNIQQTSVMQQLPLAHPGCRRNHRPKLASAAHAMRGKQECACHHIADIEGVFVHHRSAHWNRDPDRPAPSDPPRSMQCSASAGSKILCEDPALFLKPLHRANPFFEYEMSRGFQVFSDRNKFWDQVHS